MRALLDVSVLVALLDEDHVHHDRVRGWLRAHVADGWASSPTTQSGAVRVLSQPAYPNHLTPEGAGLAVRAAVTSAHHSFWPDDVSVVDPATVDLGRVHGHRQLADVHLLALAVRRAGRFVTLDRRVSVTAVPGAHGDHLVVLG